MICDNTISSGFQFWIGKALAETMIGVIVVIVALVIVGLVVWLREREEDEMTRPFPKHAYERSELETLRENLRGLKAKDEAMRLLQEQLKYMNEKVEMLRKTNAEQKETIQRQVKIEAMYLEMMTLETVVIVDGETYYLKGQDLEDFLRARCFGIAAMDKQREHDALLEMLQVQINAPSLPINPDIMRMLERSMLQTE